jgi:hypothetical protein
MVRSTHAGRNQQVHIVIGDCVGDTIRIEFTELNVVIIGKYQAKMLDILEMCHYYQDTLVVLCNEY